MAPGASGRGALEAPDALVDQDLDERLIGNAAPFRRLPGAAKKVGRYAQRDLCCALAQGLQYLALELFIGQVVEWIRERSPTRLGLHHANLLMIRLDAALAWTG